MKWFLISNRQKNNRRSVSISLYKHLKLLLALFGALKPTRFVHHNKSIFIQCVHQGPALRIMGRPVTVGTHFAHQTHFVSMDIVRHGLAHKAAVCVAANSLYLIMLSVDEKALLRVGNHRSESKSDGIYVNLMFINERMSFYRIQIWRIGRP